MLEKGKIDTTQAVMLMVSMVLPTAIITVPAFCVKYAGQDAWLSIAFATLAGLLIAWLVVSLSLRFPGKNLFEFTEEILGRTPGKIVGLLYIWWFLHANALIMNEYGGFLCTVIMPDTPYYIFFVVGAIVAGYAVRNGLEVLSRYNQLILPFIIGLMLVMFLLAAVEMKVTRLLPVFDTGLIPIVKGAVVPTSWLGEIVILSMIIPYLNKPKEALRVAAMATIFTGSFLLVGILVTLAVFGPNLSGYWVFPVFNTIRVISVANFLERLESVVIALWLLGGFAKIGVFYFAAVLGSAQWLGLRDYRPLVAPLGLILVGLAFICPNIVSLFDFLASGWPPYAIIVFEAGLPLLLLVVAMVRGKKGESC